MLTYLLSVFQHYKGWLITLLLAGAILIPSSYFAHQSVDSTFLYQAIQDDQVKSVVIVKDMLALSRKYTAEITLNTVGLKKYYQNRAGWSLDNQGPHYFLTNSTLKEAQQWRTKIIQQKNIQLFDKQRYNWIELVYDLVVGGLLLVVMVSMVQSISIYPSGQSSH